MKQQFIQYLAISLLAVLSASTEAAVNIQHWRNAAGAEIYFVENHDLPIVDISVNFPAGSARDTAEKSGVAGITKYMMTLGAAGMTDEVIANKMADIGAILSGDFDVDRAGFKLRTLSSEREKTQALEVFTKILQKPDFPEAVLTREKARIIAGLQESATQPESISEKAFMNALYGKHPYRLDGSGEVETVTNITRQDLTDFYKHFYGAKGAVIALMGDLTREQANSSQAALYAENGFAGAKKVAAWKADVRNAWSGVTLRRLDTPCKRVSFGDMLHLSVAARLNGLQPEDVVVELLVCRQFKGSKPCDFKHFRFEFSGIEESGEHLFALNFTPELCGKLEYYIRIHPYQSLLMHPLEMGMMVWL